MLLTAAVFSGQPRGVGWAGAVATATRSHGAEMLLQVLTERKETANIVFARTESFSRWIQAFTDARIGTATVVVGRSPTTSLRSAPALPQARAPRRSGHYVINHPERPRMHLKFLPSDAPDPGGQFGVAPEHLTTGLSRS